MKKIIIAAVVVLVTGVFTTSCVKQTDMKTTAGFYVNPFSTKNSIGSAD